MLASEQRLQSQYVNIKVNVKGSCEEGNLEMCEGTQV
jgi:hypothetical protein